MPGLSDFDICGPMLRGSLCSQHVIDCCGVLCTGLVSALLAAGVEFGAVRATVTGALLRVIGTALALWIPLTPLFFIMRRALNGKTNSRRGGAVVSQSA